LPLKSPGTPPEGGRQGALRDLGVFFAWTAAILILGGLSWFLTQPVRGRMLQRSVNRVLEVSGPSRQLDAPIPSWGMPGRAIRLGSWFTLKGSDDWGVVFPMVFNGIPASFLAVVSPVGEVVSLIPLGVNPEKALDSLPPEVLRVYFLRVKAANEALRAALPAVSQGRTR
jgi:hypothetical protein